GLRRSRNSSPGTAGRSRAAAWRDSLARRAASSAGVFWMPHRKQARCVPAGLERVLPATSIGLPQLGQGGLSPAGGISFVTRGMPVASGASGLPFPFPFEGFFSPPVPPREFPFLKGSLERLTVNGLGRK